MLLNFAAFNWKPVNEQQPSPRPTRAEIVKVYEL